MPASFVLGSQTSSTYPRGYASGVCSLAVLPGKRRALARRGGWVRRMCILSSLQGLVHLADVIQFSASLRCTVRF